jgi:ubiquinone/menaquinone biosynthesis C-methylase UbiE/uncharacterized protein YbaR (Trm112 family)
MFGRAAAEPDQVDTLAGLLRCPGCHAGIAIEGQEAVCSTGGHRYPIVDGVLVLLDEEDVAGDPQYDSQRAYFDAEFAGYRRYALENWRRSYLRRLRSAGALAGPLLDVGVGGSGYTVIEAARSGVSAVGCDLSLEGLVAARRFAVAEGVADRTLWVCCSAETLPFTSSSFASVLAIAVLEHLPDDVAALSEMARVLQVGGRAWTTVPHALPNISPVFRIPNRRHDRTLGHLRRYEAQTLVELGRRVGLVTEEVQFTGHPVKVLQLAVDKLLRGGARNRVWWLCERRDLARSGERRGSMQLSVLFTRSDEPVGERASSGTLGSSYDAWHRRHAREDVDRHTLAFFDWVLDLAAPEPGTQLLDVACGDGAFLSAAVLRGVEPHGIDVSQTAIEIATTNLPGADLRVGDAENLPYDDASFDVVTCLGSLEHFPSPERGAAEIARVLRPGGRAIVFVPNLFFLGHVWLGMRHGTQPSEGEQQFSESFRSSQGWIDLLEESGLRVARWETWNTIHASAKVSRSTMRLWNAAARFVPRNASYAFAFVCQKGPRRREV